MTRPAFHKKVNETRLWQWLADNDFGSKLYMCRIETGETVGGFPDVFGCLLGSTFVCELKTTYLPKMEKTPIKIDWRPKQIPWHKRYMKTGGQLTTLLQVGSGANAYRFVIAPEDNERFIDGVDLETLRQISLNDSPLDNQREIILRLAAAGREKASIS